MGGFDDKRRSGYLRQYDYKPKLKNIWFKYICFAEFAFTYDFEEL
jgi:hypothetical protein